MIKYLGVYFDSGLRINRHLHEITHKCRNLFKSLAKAPRRNGNLGKCGHAYLYKGLLEPITTYAAVGWSDLLNGKTKKILVRTQRMAFLQVTNAYRTTSTEALQVIAGVTFIDLLIEVRARLYRKKRGHDDAAARGK